MFGVINYEMFLTSSIILALIPGSDTMFILGQAISNSIKSGKYSAFGICSGLIVHTFLAAFGLSLLLKNSVTAFNLIKFLTRSKKESIRTGFQKFYNIITHNIQTFNLS